MECVTDQSSTRSFVFGRWILQRDGLLLHDGKGLHLPPKELHVLRLLLGAAGSLVSKDWLLDQVWSNCDVAEESLTRCIYALRKLLGRENDYIKTVYGKGYRFAGGSSNERACHHHRYRCPRYWSCRCWCRMMRVAWKYSAKWCTDWLPRSVKVFV